MAMPTPGARPPRAVHHSFPPALPPAWPWRERSPLRVVLLNGAPEKSTGDLRIARLLANTALQVELTILRDQHAAERDISPHLLHFYRTFAEAQARPCDALVVVGYAAEAASRPRRDGGDGLAEVVAWSRQQGHAGLFLGSAAAAVLDLHYGLLPRRLPLRRPGIVRHPLVAPGEPLLHGHDQQIWVPVLDRSGLTQGDLPPHGGLASLVESHAAGIHMLRAAGQRFTFVLNDVSADAEAIARQLGGSRPGPPDAGGSGARSACGWRAHAQLLFANWLAVEVGRQPPAIMLAADPDGAPSGRVLPGAR